VNGPSRAGEEKFGAKAFTKEGEIYLSPGSERLLAHELAHVYQQKTKNIPATAKIGQNEVNLDPQLEKEADEIAKHIEDYIPKIILEDTKHNYINHAIQFSMFVNVSQFLDHFKVYRNNEVYKKLKGIAESFKKTDTKNYKRILEIKEMLRNDKFFPEDKTPTYNLYTVMQWMTPEQYQVVVNSILTLKDYCDAKGIKSVLESANTNVIVDKFRVMLQNPNNTNYSKNKKLLLADSFAKRLELMTEYIEKVAQKQDADGETFRSKYWIRSTGSDPHHNGEHALFLVNKQNQEGYESDDTKKEGQIAKVYKPHDLSADNAVVGKNGILNSINNLFNKQNALEGTIIENETAFATMDIDVQHHTEEFIIKKSQMEKKKLKNIFSVPEC